MDDAAQNVYESSSSGDDGYDNNPGTFLLIHKKCRKVFPRAYSGFKLDIGRVDNDGSRLQIYYNKFGPDIGGIVDFKFDDSARFRYLTFPLNGGGHLRKAQIEGRTQNSSFGVDVGPAVNLHFLHRLEDPKRYSDTWGLRWTKKLLEPKDAKVDIGGQFMTNFHHAVPFIGLRYSTSQYIATAVVGYKAFMASIWCQTEGAEFGISHEHYGKDLHLTTFGCRREYKPYGFTHSIACSTNQTVRVEFEQKLPTSIPIRLILTYAVQMQMQQDRLGFGIVIN